MATVDAVLWKRILKSNFSWSLEILSCFSECMQVCTLLLSKYIMIIFHKQASLDSLWISVLLLHKWEFLWSQRAPLTSLLQIVAVECPAGTYMTSSGKSCERCPKGQYQNQSGQVACESCPPGTSTLAMGSSGLSQCLGTMTVTWYFNEQCFSELMALLSEKNGFVFGSHKWSVSCSSNQCVITCTIAHQTDILSCQVKFSYWFVINGCFISQNFDEKMFDFVR